MVKVEDWGARDRSSIPNVDRSIGSIFNSCINFFKCKQTFNELGFNHV